MPHPIILEIDRYLPRVQEERCPDPVELVGHVPLSEGEEAAHVVHAADLRHRVLSDGPEYTLYKYSFHRIST